MNDYETPNIKEEDDIGAKISSLRKNVENGREREDGRRTCVLTSYRL